MKFAVSFLALTIMAAAAGAAVPARAQTGVPVDQFRSVQLRGGGHVVIRRGPEQRVSLTQGSTRFTHFHVDNNGQLLIDACNEDCPHHYDLDIEIVTPEISGVAISGGGKIETANGYGRQRAISAAIEGGGLIDIRSIQAERADAAIDGGGNISLRAERQLEAAVSGGGNVSYWGNPSVTSAVDGGGSVNKGG